MRDRVIVLPTAMVGGLVAVGLVTVLAPVRSQAGPMVGIVNMARLQRYARVIQTARDQRARERLDRQALLERHEQFPLLVGDEARRAVELDLKDVQRTAEENQELIALRRKSSEMDLEHVKLIGRGNPSEQEVARRDELQAARNRRSDEIEALRKQLEGELMRVDEGLQRGVDDAYAAALKSAAEQTGVQVIVASHILVPQPAVEARAADFRWENVVCYGGRDVTDALITVMNGGEAPPPPAPEEQGMAIPGAVK